MSETQKKKNIPKMIFYIVIGIIVVGIIQASIVLGLFFMLGNSIKNVNDPSNFIPAEMGQAEGLYVYYNNYRSLTDGSQKEQLLKEVTIDGKTYPIGEITDERDIKYMTSYKEIIYRIETSDDEENIHEYLWHYNYETKEDGLFYAPEKNEVIKYFSVSDSYILVKTRFVDRSDWTTYNKIKGMLYDGNLNLVQDGLENYVLSEDYLYYSDEEMNGYHLWKNGNFYSVKIEEPAKDLVNISRLYDGKSYYVFSENSIYVMDLDSGKMERIFYGDGNKYAHGTGALKKSGEKFYIITYKNIEETKYEYSPLRTDCTLWTLNGIKLEKLCEFDNKYEAEFYGGNEQYINFRLECIKNTKKEVKGTTAYYDVEQGKLVMNKKMSITTETKRNVLIVGEYEFYFDTKAPFSLWVTPYQYYYLHRIYNGKDEIVQYYKGDDRDPLNPILYKDIYVK